MMRNNLNTFLKCICIAILAVIFANMLAFGIEIIQNGLGDNWYFRYKHAIFYVDDKPVGLAWGETQTNIFMVVMFFIALIKNFKKGGFA